MLRCLQRSGDAQFVHDELVDFKTAHPCGTYCETADGESTDGDGGSATV